MICYVLLIILNHPILIGRLANPLFKQTDKMLGIFEP
jgi:hypothetical protein